jgi:GNAT superfamily N-acetyltransferase
MTPEEFAAFRKRLVGEYASEHVRAGTWSPEEAEARSAGQIDQLLSQGADTPGMLVLTAETKSGESIGQLGVGLSNPGGSGGGAWIYDIEVVPAERGKGYGRALLAMAEEQTIRNGATAIGLNVFGPNKVARSLYETSGYEIVAQVMRKQLVTPR